MLNTLWLCGFAMLVCSDASNSAGKKQAIINVGGASDIQGALLRTARSEADLDGDLKNLQMMPGSESKRTDANPQMSMSLIAKGSSSPDIDGDLKKLMDAAADSDKATADTKASDNASNSDVDMKSLMASLSQSPSEKNSSPESFASLDSPDNKDHTSKTSDDDPEMDKAMAGIDAELKQESAPDNSSTVSYEGPLKFQALDKVLGDLKAEQQENGGLSTSLNKLGDGEKDNVDDDKQMKQMDAALASLGNSKDLEQSLADLDQIDQNSSLPNAASLLELEVDDAANERMSRILHRMGQMGGHIKHLSRRIDSLHRLHHKVQNGASLLQLSVDNDMSKNGKQDNGAAKELDKELEHVEKTWTKVSGSVPKAALTQLASAQTSKEDEAWLNNQVGGEQIDAKQDDKIMKELLAKFEAKYGPLPSEQHN